MRMPPPALSADMTGDQGARPAPVLARGGRPDSPHLPPAPPAPPAPPRCGPARGGRTAPRTPPAPGAAGAGVLGGRKGGADPLAHHRNPRAGAREFWAALPPPAVGGGDAADARLDEPAGRQEL